MKILRTTVALILLISVFVFNWYCNNENLQNIGSPEKTQTDALPDGVTLNIYEYCYITPPPGQGEPFYHYRSITGIMHDIYPIGYTYGSFTTPPADRYDEYGYRYQTQYFKFTESARNVYVCASCNCAARYNITGQLSYDHFYCTGTCRDCQGSSQKNCWWGEERDQRYLPENTTYNMWVGSDCIVGDGGWEIGE